LRSAGSHYDRHGRSPKGTVHKEAFFSETLGWWLARASRASSTTYYHLDGNAGPGSQDPGVQGKLAFLKCSFNPFDLGNGFKGSRVNGTPGLILGKVPRFPGLRFHITFVDRDPRAMTLLRQFVAASGVEAPGLFDGPRAMVNCMEADNNWVFRQYVSMLETLGLRPAASYGSVISDPNGWAPGRGGAADLDVLAALFSRLPHFILLVRFPAGLAKKNRGWLLAEPGRRMTTRLVKDHFALRPHWLISEPFGHTGLDLALCGSPEPIPPRPAHGIHDVLSLRGQEILHDADTIHSRCGDADPSAG
jgi:hypothetical protein